MTEEEKTAENAAAEEKKEENKADKNAEMAPPPMGNPFEGGVSKDTPGGLVIIAILFIIGGIMWLIYPFLYSIALIDYYKSVVGYIPWITWGLTVTCCWIGSWLVGFLYFGIAGGLMKGMKGAWLWAVIFAIIGLFNVPIGTIISLIILVYLFRPTIRGWFKN